MPKKEIAITAVWLRRRGGENDPNATAEVLVEIDGVWRKAIAERLDGNFSHCAHGNGADRWPADDVTEPPARGEGGERG